MVDCNVCLMGDSDSGRQHLASYLNLYRYMFVTRMKKRTLPRNLLF